MLVKLRPTQLDPEPRSKGQAHTFGTGLYPSFMTPITPKSTPKLQEREDEHLDLTLRPKTWNEYIGQKKIKENLRVFIDAAKKRGQALEHVLLYGPAGLGKTSLAHIIAREIGKSIKVTSGPAIEKAGDLGAILTNLEEGDILFIDEAHRLNKLIEEVLYPAMEDFKLDIVIGKGASARILELRLPHFTLIAATTRIGLLSGPLRSRFGSTYRLDFYNESDIQEILKRSSRLLNTNIEERAIDILSKSSRRTPRVANRLLKRARDLADVKGEGVVTEDIAQKILTMLDVDPIGLEAVDRKMLEVIIRKFSGGPVGLHTIAAVTNEEAETIEEIYEPYLLQLGFIERTSKGRVATKAAYEHLGIPLPGGDQEKLI